MRWTVPAFQANWLPICPCRCPSVHLHMSVLLDWNGRSTLLSFGRLVTADVSLSNASSLGAAGRPCPVFLCCGVRWLSWGSEGGGCAGLFLDSLLHWWCACAADYALYQSLLLFYAHFNADYSNCDPLLNQTMTWSYFGRTPRNVWLFGANHQGLYFRISHIFLLPE